MNQPNIHDEFTRDVPMEDDEVIAVIGMAGRFPKAPTLAKFWDNLAQGVECIEFFSPEELEAAGVSALVRSSPNFVPARAILDDPASFDAGFFAINPSEAEHTDPQHRLFLETSWQALEDAGYDPSRYAGLIGVFAGADINSYSITNLLLGARGLQTLIGNDKDYLATRVAYKLHLRGPAITIQTACSTSLVAVHMACQSLLSYQSDMALAGGVGVNFPQKGGYLFEEGSILSPDGHCRPFDASAKGTVGGDGVGVVVLKRYSEALADNDQILAVIRGSAINNDGSAKVGFTAPSVEGQAAVIAQAHATAGVSADSITYVETHGTGTQLGDPVEVSALTDVFRASTDRKGFCAIGSLKSNVGHMNSAAGVGSLIKTILALRHRKIPPSLHYETANPLLDLENGPFYVAAELHDWPSGSTPRRAGVSSFGIGGTNAHVVLEEVPPRSPRDEGHRAAQCLPVSARSRAATRRACEQLADWLDNNPDANLADVAYTLQAGRRRFSHRSAIVASDKQAAITALRSEERKTIMRESKSPRLAFLFPGQGSQYATMGRQLYQREPVFRTELDHATELLAPMLGLDLRTLLFPAPGMEPHANKLLAETRLTQPALFAFEYALACWWRSIGVEPQAMLGHSVGEYVAACLAGVFSLSDGLKLIAERGRLIQAQPRGSMLAVALAEAEAAALPGVTLAAINGPRSSVVAGPDKAIAELERTLKGQGARRLHTSHAFHSPMLKGMAEAFRRCLADITLRAPEIPFVSNVTGNWISTEEAQSPEYWIRHCLRPVQFAASIAELAREGDIVLLEVGPGHSLTTLVRKHGWRIAELPSAISVRHPKHHRDDSEHLMEAVGALYSAGVDIDWPALHGSTRRRLSLPTYPFERERYWADPQHTLKQVFETKPFYGKTEDPAKWLYTPVWRRALPALPAQLRPAGEAGEGQGATLVFARNSRPAAAILERLRERTNELIVVWLGDAYARIEDSQSYMHEYRLDPLVMGSYQKLIGELTDFGVAIKRVVHLWQLDSAKPRATDIESFESAQACGYYSLLFLAKALGKANLPTSIEINVVTSGVAEVMGTETLHPERAPSLGVVLAMSQEYTKLAGRVLDIEVGPGGGEAILDQVVAQMWTPIKHVALAFRGRHRWTADFEPVVVPEEALANVPLRRGGTYLITGGLGGIGHIFAKFLAHEYDANLVLTGRTGVPAREEWDAWLSSHAGDNKVSVRIRQLRRLEEAGAQLLTLAADVGNREQMQHVWQQAKERFGRIHGVIHAAGHVGQGLLKPIAEATIEQSQLHFHPKVHGLYTLADTMPADVELCVITSSLAAILGGVGGAAYAAANAFMDAFCHAHTAPSTRWLAINWDAWMPHEGSPEAEGPTPAWARFAIEPDEGVVVLHNALATAGHAQLVISTIDLPMRLAQLMRADDGGEAEVAEVAARHHRPAQNNEYVAPRDEMETILAEIWQALLGIDKVGVFDNFFKLGGDSLVAIQLGTRLRDALGIEVTVSLLFDEPTIAGLAKKLKELMEEPQASVPAVVATDTPDAELIAQLDMIENMSAAQVQRMLAEMEAGGAAL